MTFSSTPNSFPAGQSVTRVSYKSISISLLILSGWMLQVAECRYKCTRNDFIRLGNSCYFLSSEITSWQESHFRCRDKGAQLAVLGTYYEDSTLRSYLERPEFAQLGRWIGGMLAAGKWIWAAQGSEIDMKMSFATTDAYNVQDTDNWLCLYMDPNSRYHWNKENCMHQLHYVCETPLAKVIDVTNSTTSDTGSTTEAN